jgi:hypothetical protein
VHDILHIGRQAGVVKLAVEKSRDAPLRQASKAALRRRVSPISRVASRVLCARTR